jgi:lysozyme family protein
MSLFQKAIEEVLKNEGVGLPNNPTGYVNDPDDTGGMTNYGITYKTYARWAKIPAYRVTENDMRNISYGNALRIYKELYWDKLQGDKIKKFPIAYALLDFSVNKGPHRVIPMVQEILGGVPVQANRSEASIIMNSETLKKLNSLNDEQARQFLSVFFDKIDDGYYQIVQNNSSQQKFLNGWLKRVNKAREFADINFALINAKTVGLGLGISAIAIALALRVRSELA